MKGKALNGRISLATLTLAASISAPLAAAAQTITYYTPPTLVKRGTSTSPIGGPGTVIVQVMVKPDASFKVVRVIHSTNAQDNAAALEIAKTSSYKSASRGSQRQIAFYDFTLKFTGKGGAAATTASDDSGGTAKFDRMIRTGDYGGAQSGLKSYVVAHPSDGKAQQLLGVADTFLNQDEDATGAFDKGGAILPIYRSVATKAYSDYSAVASKNNEPDKAVASAKKAVALQPGFFTYDALGSAESTAGQNDAALADLEKARSLGTGAKSADRAIVDANLASIYLASDKPDMALKVAAEAKQLDPAETATDNIFANYYAKQAQTQATAGKNTAAAASYEQGAAVAPGQAAALYTQAAFMYLSALPKADPTSAKADADKALALKPDDAAANYAAGVALADQGNAKDALVFLNKADTLAKSANDSKLTDQIESAIKQLGTSSK